MKSIIFSTVLAMTVFLVKGKALFKKKGDNYGECLKIPGVHINTPCTEIPIPEVHVKVTEGCGCENEGHPDDQKGWGIVN